MSYKMLVLDIDGTLTNSKKEITSKTKAAIRNLQEKGIAVVLASGRPTPGVENMAKELEFEKFGGYILSYNGGQIIDCQTGEKIYEKVLPKEAVSELYDLSEEYDLNIISYEDGNVIIEKEQDQYVELEARINKIGIKQINDFKEYIDFPVVKCLMTAEGKHLEKIEPIAKERFPELSIYRSEPFFLEAMAKNVDKAASLERLLEHLELTKDEMVACGDGFNDLSMIEYAGMGVAMENAQPVVKEVADYVTLSNDREGIVHVIDKFFA